MSQMILEYDEFDMFLLNIKVLILWPQTFLTLLKMKQNAPYYIKNFEILWQDFSLFKNFEENLYISHNAL